MKLLARGIAVLLAGATLMFGVTTAHAAGMSGHTVTVSRVVGPYRLVLKIGPAENMNMNGGEMTTGGAKAACAMKMAHGVARAMSMHACNRHVELHVYRAKGGAVVHGAKVAISMLDAAKHMSIMVPIATMMAAKQPKDFHYGNNVYAGPGKYAVTVRVNGRSTIFHVTLM